MRLMAKPRHDCAHIYFDYWEGRTPGNYYTSWVRIIGPE